MSEQTPALQIEKPKSTEPLHVRLQERVRTGDLGSWPVVIALILVVLVFSQTAENFFTPANLTNILTQMSGTCPARLRRRPCSDRRDRSFSELRQRGRAVVVAKAQLPNGSPALVRLRLPGLLAACAIGAFGDRWSRSSAFRRSS
jgi:hypothetical protein